jgi:flavin-dependent dehydrogenase
MTGGRRVGLAATPAREAEVVVIGGGPAGTTAARLLAAWGHTVILLNRRGPVLPLAESLPPSCRGILDRVGLAPAVDRAGFMRASGNTVWWGTTQQERRIESFGEGRWGLQVFRPAFDRLLRELAIAAGVDVREGTVTDVRVMPNGGLEVLASDAGGPRSWWAGWVVDATGRAGLLSRRRGRQVERTARTTALVGLWERPDGWPLPDPTHTVVESFASGWGWTIPASETRRCVALMLDPNDAPARRDLDDRLATGLARTRLLGPLLEGARRAGPAFSCDATAYCTRDVASGRTFLVGDAASFIDPLSSYGVKKALTSAWLAAVCIHSATLDPALAEPGTALFCEREQAYVSSAHRALAAIAGDAAEASDFWSARRALADGEEDEAVDPAVAWRRDPQVQAAFAQLKARDRLSLVRGPAGTTVDRAVIAGNRIELQGHLVLDDATGPVRYVRSVNLVQLAEVATSHTDVGVMYETYCRECRAVPLPDFLGALSALLARDVLRLA